MAKRTAMSANRIVLTGALLLGCGLVLADDEEEEAPDMEFLEYLGFWEESDEEWLIFDELGPVTAELEERNDPAPKGEASTEAEDES